jgi:4-aminobutyrate aminotransferase
MIGAEFVHADKSPAPKELDEVLETLKDNGFIIGKGGVGRNVMAFQPPLVITKENVDDVLNALDLVLSQKNFSC